MPPKKQVVAKGKKPATGTVKKQVILKTPKGKKIATVKQLKPELLKLDKLMSEIVKKKTVLLQEMKIVGGEDHQMPITGHLPVNKLLKNPTVVGSKWIGNDKKWIRSDTGTWELDVSPPLKQKLVVVNIVNGKKKFNIIQVSYAKEDELERAGVVERYVRLDLEDVRYIMLKKNELLKCGKETCKLTFNREIKSTGTNVRLDKKLKAVVMRNGSNQIYLSLAQFNNLVQYLQEFPAMTETQKISEEEEAGPSEQGMDEMEEEDEEGDEEEDGEIGCEDEEDGYDDDDDTIILSDME